jgi:hypothetical protein
VLRNYNVSWGLVHPKRVDFEIFVPPQSGALTYEPIPMQNSGVVDQSYGAPPPGNELDVKSQIDQQFVEISNQFNELSTQYESYTGQEQAPVAQVPMYGQNYDQQVAYPDQQQQPSFGQVPYYGQPAVESEPSPQQQQQYEPDYGQTDYNYAGDGSQSQTDGYGQNSYDAWNTQPSEVSRSE